MLIHFKDENDVQGLKRRPGPFIQSDRQAFDHIMDSLRAEGRADSHVVQNSMSAAYQTADAANSDRREILIRQLSQSFHERA